MNMLFGPLDRSYCSYFYYLEVMFFCIFVFMAGVALKTVLTSKKYDSMQLFLVILQKIYVYGIYL